MTAPPATASVAHPTGRRVVRRVWQAVLDIGRRTSSDGPAPRRRLDHEEVERRLTELYPRA